MVHLVVVITMTTKKQLCDTTFLLQMTTYSSFKDSKRRNAVKIWQISLFKIRKVEQFEASSSTDSTADVYHMVHWREYSI